MEVGTPQRSRGMTEWGTIMAQCFICRMFGFSNGHHRIYLPIMCNLSGKSPVSPELFSSSCVVEKEAAILSWQTPTRRSQKLAGTDCQGKLVSPDPAPLALRGVGSVSSRQGHLKEFNLTSVVLIFTCTVYRWQMRSAFCFVLWHNSSLKHTVKEARDSISKPKQWSKKEAPEASDQALENMVLENCYLNLFL